MTVTIAKCGKDRYINIENEKELIVYEAKLIKKFSEVTYMKTGNQDTKYEYEDEVFEATFMRRETKVENENKSE